MKRKIDRRRLTHYDWYGNKEGMVCCALRVLLPDDVLRRGTRIHE